MKSISEQLIDAATIGNQVYVKKLLLHPDCDTKLTSKLGMNALMSAAYNGHTSCVQL